MVFETRYPAKYHDGNEKTSFDSHVLANTVAQNESMYTKREVEEAKQARDLHRMLAYPSFKDMSEALKWHPH